MARSAKRTATRMGGADALRVAGLALFAELGFEGASTHAIAERARLPQGLVRYHFGSKEGLWRDVMAAGTTDLLGDLSARAQDPAAITEALPLSAATHRHFVQAVCHALLEPGARRDWLIGEIAARARPQLQGLRTSLSPSRAHSQDGEIAALMWLGAALAMAAFAPALERTRGAALDRDRALRLQRELLEAWLAPERAAHAAGPWSIAAALARRRLGTPGGV